MKITAAIPAFNAARFLRPAIESVLAQSHPCDEVLVVDDGSTDETAAIAASFPAVRCITQPNGGDANARNRAIEEASGDVIAFLDADDIWLPDKIERQVARLKESPETAMVYTSIRVVDHDLRLIDTMLAAPTDVALRNTLLVEKPYMTGVGSSGMVKRDVARATKFDERLRASADWAFACRVALRHPVAGIVEPLVLYRQHTDSQVHLNLTAVESDVLLTWREVFDNPEASHLVRYQRRARANLYLSLATSYFKRGDRANFLRYVTKAAVRRPDRLAAALWRRYMGVPVERQIEELTK